MKKKQYFKACITSCNLFFLLTPRLPPRTTCCCFTFILSIEARCCLLITDHLPALSPSCIRCRQGAGEWTDTKRCPLLLSHQRPATVAGPFPSRFLTVASQKSLQQDSTKNIMLSSEGKTLSHATCPILFPHHREMVCDSRAATQQSSLVFLLKLFAQRVKKQKKLFTYLKHTVYTSHIHKFCNPPITGLIL